MAKFKRTVNSWIDDFYTVWNKVNIFKRIVLGIIVAGACFLFFTKKINQPILAEIVKANEQIEKKSIPTPIPEIDKDEKVPGLEVSIESAKRILPREKRALDKSLKSKKQINLKTKTKALRKFNTLLATYSLRVDKLEAYKEPEQKKGSNRRRQVAKKKKELLITKDCPLKVWVNTYEVTGLYLNCLKFLIEANKFPYPARVRNIKFERIEIPEKYSNNKIRVVCKLSFTMELYYHGK